MGKLTPLGVTSILLAMVHYEETVACNLGELLLLMYSHLHNIIDNLF